MKVTYETAKLEWDNFRDPYGFTFISFHYKAEIRVKPAFGEPDLKSLSTFCEMSWHAIHSLDYCGHGCYSRLLCQLCTHLFSNACQQKSQAWFRSDSNLCISTKMLQYVHSIYYIHKFGVRNRLVLRGSMLCWYGFVVCLEQMLHS